MKKRNPYFLIGRVLILPMKFIVFFTLLGSLQLTVSVYAQKTLLTLKLSNVSIAEVLTELEQQSEFTFLYRSNLFNEVERKDVDFSNVTVSQCLDEYLVQQGFEYEVEDKTVVIRKRVIPVVNDIQQEEKLTITGTVKDDVGIPLPGVTVRVKGTTTGTITDLEGKYTMNNIPEDAILLFSFIGMLPQKIAVNGQTSIDLTMQEDTVGLEEVVVVGYGVKKKSVVTGAISSLSSDELLQSKPSNVSSALNGRASGVVVSPASGQPGTTPSVTIRGVGTNGNSSPLYIIDGLPMGDMNAVNPNDIESMEVLKDATSAAIYGARAANGVILITTKKGKAGQSTFTYDGFTGVQNAYNVPEMMNSEQYINMVKQFHDNDNPNEAGNYPDWIKALNPDIDTDWFDEITQTAPITEHNLTATFGGKKGSTLLSLSYRTQDGIIGGDEASFERYSARINTNQKVKDWFTIGANVNVMHMNRNILPTWLNSWNVAHKAFSMEPTSPIYAGPGTDYPDMPYDDRGYAVTTAPALIGHNPIHFMKIVGSNNTRKTDLFYGNAFVKIEPVKNLIIKTDIAANIGNTNNKNFTPAYYHNSYHQQESSLIEQNSNRSTFWQWENTITYTYSFGGHNLSSLLGITASENHYQMISGTRNNLPEIADNNSDWWYLNAGDVATAMNNGTANARHAIASIFGRVSYDYKNKYMMEVVIRRDGSTNFGPQNKYAVFPGVSAGWNISSEDFWKVEHFDILKLRASWGQNGNEAISPFSFTSIMGNDYYYVFGNNPLILPGSVPNTLVNPDVRWETSEQFNVGADMTFYNGKLRANIDYYTKKTKDLLLEPVIENVRGNDTPFYNVGEVSNHGVEMQISYNINIGDVQLGINANASYLKNEVISVGNDNGYIEGAERLVKNEIATRMQEGYPLGHFIGYKTRGIFQNQEQINSHAYADGTLIQPDASPGDLIFEDLDGQGGITSDDRTMIGNPWPKWTYGLNINVMWKGFDFSTFFTGKLDLDVMDGFYQPNYYGSSNMPAFYTEAWKQEGDNTNIPRFTATDPNQNNILNSDFFVYDASFLKIGTVEFGYTFPRNILDKVKLSRIRIYAAMDNVAIFTKYPFFDPEVGAMGNNILSTGIDHAVYPQGRTSRIGITVDF